jgi:hypothetical protein
MSRRPVVAGQFYPGNARRLRSQIESFSPDVEPEEGALGALSPHAGYTFSGGVAGETFARTGVPDAVLLLTPSHNYATPPLALWTGGNWQTPLGEVELHEGLTEGLAGIGGVTCDDRPHGPEHSGEVVLPFLQHHNPDVRVAVVCVTSAADLTTLVSFGEAVGGLLDDQYPETLVVTSSDMSHESGPRALEVVNEHDPMAIEQMEALDADGLHRVCRRESITMCGVLPAVAMMAAVKERGGTEGVLVARATSADSPAGSGSYIVGYAGMLFR